MAGWLTLMLVIAVAGREAARELSVFQIMLLRSTLGMAMLWPLVRAAGGLAAVSTKRLPQHTVRNAIHYVAQYGWFVALTLIPLAQVVSIEFTMPIWSAALAVLFLGERMSGLKWVAVLLGLVGVAVINGVSRHTSPKACLLANYFKPTANLLRKQPSYPFKYSDHRTEYQMV